MNRRNFFKNITKAAPIIFVPKVITPYWGKERITLTETPYNLEITSAAQAIAIFGEGTKTPGCIQSKQYRLMLRDEVDSMPERTKPLTRDEYNRYMESIDPFYAGNLGIPWHKAAHEKATQCGNSQSLNEFVDYFIDCLKKTGAIPKEMFKDKKS